MVFVLAGSSGHPIIEVDNLHKNNNGEEIMAEAIAIDV